MKTLRVSEVEFQGIINPGAMELVYEKLKSFSYEFEFGKSYLLNGKEGEGGWALSWIVGGVLEPQHGTISLDNVPYTKKQRAEIAWCVHNSEIKFLGFRRQSTKRQIRHGLRTMLNVPIASEEEVMKRFILTPQRYNRIIWHMGNEGWRASCAIGLVNGRTIFCFTYMPAKLIDAFSLWLKEILDLLKSFHALVLFPAELTPEITQLCDEVIPVN